MPRRGRRIHLSKEERAKIQEEREKNRNEIRELIAEFAAFYGTNAEILEGWISLCTDIEVDIGITISECKENLRAVAVNIWDLMDAKKLGEHSKRFESRDLLNEAIREGRSRVFPLRDAKANGFLTALLVEVF